MAATGSPSPPRIAAAKPFNPMEAPALNDVWVIGEEGVSLHWNGGDWSSVNIGTSNTLRGIWESGGTAWAVGAGGTILHYAP